MESVTAWVAQPFSTSMSLWSWALFVIVILTICYLWNDVVGIIAEKAV